MLLVNLIADQEQWDLFLNLYPMENFDDPVQFQRNQTKDANLTLSLLDWSFQSCMSVIHAQIQREARILPSDNLTMARIATSRYIGWRQQGYPNADSGIPEFLARLKTFNTLQPMWCCSGHVDEKAKDGYICFTGLQKELLAVGKGLSTLTGAPDNLVVQLKSLRHEDTNVADQCIIYPVLMLRWPPVAEELQAAQLTAIADCITEAARLTYLKKMHRRGRNE